MTCYWIRSVPGNITFPRIISPIMQPTDQMSTVNKCQQSQNLNASNLKWGDQSNIDQSTHHIQSLSNHADHHFYYYILYTRILLRLIKELVAMAFYTIVERNL